MPIVHKMVEHNLKMFQQWSDTWQMCTISIIGLNLSIYLSAGNE